MRIIVLAVSLLLLVGCQNGNKASNIEPKMSEKALLLYNKTESKVSDLEQRISMLGKGTDRQVFISVLSDAKKLTYDFDSTGMNPAAIDKCKSLQRRIEEVQKAAIVKTESYILESDIIVYQGQDVLLEKMVEYPVYVEKGDRLYYEISLQSAIPVKIYNMDAGSTVKTYNKSSIKDSLIVAHSGIYLIEIKPSASQYASIDISYHTANKDRLYNPKSVRTETVSCSKGDFRAYGIKGVQIQNLFEEPRKFTLRSQLKSAFSGSSIALVPINVPAGATDILYTMRIATSEQDRTSDGNFHKDLIIKYNQIKFMGLPLYERNQGSGLLKMLLDDNRPLREEDAYCDMYVFRSQSEAKKFQDGTAGTSELKYDVDCSTVGTQSCNGRVPTNGSSKLYLGFQNVRMRYTNYLWVEAVAVIPTTEYYRTKYTID